MTKSASVTNASTSRVVGYQNLNSIFGSVHFLMKQKGPPYEVPIYHPTTRKYQNGASSRNHPTILFHGVRNEGQAMEPPGEVWGCLLEGFRLRYGVFLVSTGNRGCGGFEQGMEEGSSNKFMMLGILM